MKQKLLKTLGNNLLLLCVGLPTLTVGVYTTYLANDELAASATAIVKENQGSSGPAMPGIAGPFEPWFSLTIAVAEAANSSLAK